MAIIQSAQSGNFTDTATWVGGVVPTVGDTAEVLAGHIVAIDSEITCDELTNDNTSGYFDLEDGGIVNANITGGSLIQAPSFHNGTLRYNGTTSAIINGNVTQTINSTSRTTINFVGTGELFINGDILSSIGSYAPALGGVGDGTITVVGDILLPVSGNNRRSVILRGNVTLNINGDIYGGRTFDSGGVEISGENKTSELNFTGNIVLGTQAGAAIYFGNGTGEINITADVFGGTNTDNVTQGIAIFYADDVTLNINGDVTGGSNVASYGVLIDIDSQNARVNIEGDVTGGVASAVRVFDLTGQVTVDGNITYSNLGVTPIFAPKVRVVDTQEISTTYTAPAENDGAGDPVVHAPLGVGMPDEGDVRDGVTYSGDALTGTLVVPLPADVREGVEYDSTAIEGTLVVPPASLVSAGVPVDDTVGTAVLNIDVVGALFEAFESN